MPLLSTRQSVQPVSILRDDEEVDRRLGTDVVEREAEVVLVEDIGGDLAGDDAVEDGLGHTVDVISIGISISISISGFRRGSGRGRGG